MLASSPVRSLNHIRSAIGIPNSTFWENALSRPARAPTTSSASCSPSMASSIAPMCILPTALFPKMRTKLLTASAIEAIELKNEPAIAPPSVDAVGSFLGECRERKSQRKVVDRRATPGNTRGRARLPVRDRASGVARAHELGAPQLCGKALRAACPGCGAARALASGSPLIRDPTSCNDRCAAHHSAARELENRVKAFHALCILRCARDTPL